MRKGIPKLTPSLTTPPGVCRLCEQPILRADGGRNMRRLWHPECAERYMFHTSNAEVRRQVFARDRGICADCGVDASPIDVEMVGRQMRRRARWDADHIVPLAEGGVHEMSNLRTLCVPCHKARTRAQVARRRKDR